MACSCLLDQILNYALILFSNDSKKQLVIEVFNLFWHQFLFVVNIQRK